MASHFEQFPLLDLGRFVDFSDVLIGEFLRFLTRSLFIVLAALLGFVHRFKMVDAIMPYVANCGVTGFRLLMQLFDELLAALLVESGNGQANGCSIVRGGEVQV